jgi:KUP system potassium uptake protein
MFVTFFDTCMVSLAAMFVWRISPYYIFFPWLTIACLDGTFLSSALVKVPDGAWFTITLASVLAASFILWRFGKENQWAAEAADRFPTSHFVKKMDDGQLRLVDKFGGGNISRIKGFGIYFDKAGETTPIVFSQFVIKLIAAPEVMVFFHLRPLETPTVAPENRYTISRLAIPNCYRLIVRHGYMDEVVTPDLAAIIYEQVRNYVVTRGRNRGAMNPITGSDPIHEEAVRKRIAAALPPPVETDAMKAKKEAEAEAKAEAETKPAEESSSQEESNATSSSQDPETNQFYTPPTMNGKDRAPAPQVGSTDTTEIDIELAKLEEAYAHQVLYIIGKEEMHVKKTGIFRKVLLEIFLWIRSNTRTKIANLRVPTDRVIEVGFVKDV